MFFSMLLSSGSILSNILFTRGAFLRRKWLFMCLVRMIWPVPVTLKRRAAPLWVFILGIEKTTPLLTIITGISKTRQRGPQGLIITQACVACKLAARFTEYIHSGAS